MRTENTATPRSMPQAPPPTDGAPRTSARWRLPAIVRARPLLPVALILGALALLMYAPPVFDHGFYYDDWELAATMQDAPGGSFVTDYFNACTDADPSSRPGSCLYHATAYFAFGQNLKGYHVLALVFVWLTAMLIYTLLARARLPKPAALGVAAAFVLFPGSDSTRLWPTANNLSWSLMLSLLGMLAGIAALERGGRRRWAFGTLALGLFLWSMLTYDGMVPMVALAGVVFWLAVPGRQAIVAGVATLGFAGAFVIWRTLFGVRDPASFNVERTTGELIEREWKLITSAWETFDQLFLPGVGGWIALAALAVVAAAAIRVAESRRAIATWAGAAVAGVVVVLASASVYVTAHDLYVPQPSSVFNRLNAAASIGYCLVFVAGLAALYVAVRALVAHRRAPLVAALLVGVLTVPVALHQYEWERTTQDSYAESWRQQVRALNAIVVKIDQVQPRGATIVSFGHPIWEARFIPVFAADWDLRGAIDERTDHDPAAAVPWTPDLSCGAEGVNRGQATYLPYNSAYPMFWIDTASYRVVRIRSQRACQKWLGRFGPPPYFGKTVTG